MGRVTRFLQPKKASPSEGSKAADDLEDAKMDPNLAKVIDAWPQLPKHIRAAILALVHVGKDTGR